MSETPGDLKNGVVQKPFLLRSHDTMAVCSLSAINLNLMFKSEIVSLSWIIASFSDKFDGSI